MADLAGLFLRVMDDNPCGGRGDGEDPGGAPPGSPPTYKYEGPWFTTQLGLSAVIGVFSFVVFSYCRTRWPLLFAPRTKLKGFSPHEAHAQQAFFGWILPTIRTSEFTILQIVGLDAAVLLSFFRMAFTLFSTCSVLAMLILMPINYKSNADRDEDNDSDWPCYTATNGTVPPREGRDWLDLISDANSYLSVHLVFTYLFTLLTLRFTYRNYRQFLRARQLFSLELVHSIPARTAMVTELPPHLRGERALAEYFESMGLAVESVSVCREVDSLKALLDARTKALLVLEQAWVRYVGNPSTVEAFDPSDNAVPPLVDIDATPGAVEAAQPQRLVVPNQPRPTIRTGWFTPKVDALEHLDTQFKEADDAVKQRRTTGKFRATHVAFVTFEKMSYAQIAVQTAQASSPFECHTHLAPEPRDIIWANMSHTPGSLRVREVLVLAAMGVLLFFWVFPIATLAGLLSYKEIQKTLPWFARLIDRHAQIKAIVQNSLPSVAMISLNASLPFILEALTYMQGYRARSWIEYSLLKKYFLFLLINVVFIFLLASTYWQLVRELADSPAKIPERLAEALSKGRAKAFFLSYVILQGLGIMPLQLLNLGVIIPTFFYRMFITRTPRDFAELNAPPMINYGVVYPQAILVFVITLLYSVVQPLILVFGAIYFGVAYVVYKYKLLFVFYKPYESQGQAWPITFARLIWGVVIFLVFMTGIFILRKSYILSSLLVPLLGAVVLWSWYIDRTFTPLSKYVNLSSVCEVQRGEDSADVVRMKAGHPVTWSQSHLSRRRYAQNDETLYVAPEDERTDYSQPPMANWYSGVLNTGKRRYGHPALNGVLPQPWLPLKKGQTLVNRGHPNNGKGSKDNNPAVVLTLRRRFSTNPRSGKNTRRASRDVLRKPDAGGVEFPRQSESPEASNPSLNQSVLNPWEDAISGPSRTPRDIPANGQQHLRHHLSFDDASGVIMLPDDDWMMEDVGSDSDSEDYGSTEGQRSREASASVPVAHEGEGENGLSSVASTPTRQRYRSVYFHHPERRRQTIPGAFPGSSRA